MVAKKFAHFMETLMRNCKVLMKSNIKTSGELKPAFTLHSQTLLSSLTPPYLDLLAKIDFISK
jgi:hypothetical protein